MSELSGLAGGRQRVVVVGGSSGIGLATVQQFAVDGAAVYALSRRGDAPVAGADGRAGGAAPVGTVTPLAVNATDADAIGRCLADVVAEGDIDTLVYCAGLNVPERRLSQLTSATWRSMVAINLDGAYYAVAGCLESLRRRQGTVILVSSASALWTNQSGAAYQASKAGLMALARAGNFEEHGAGVRFTTIFPGVVDTPHLDRRPRPPDAATRRRMLTTDDVASACRYVAGLPPRVCIPELVLLPTALQTPGNTCVE